MSDSCENRIVERNWASSSCWSCLVLLVVYHLHGETSSSTVCANGEQKWLMVSLVRIGHLQFTQTTTTTKTIYRTSLIQGGGEELQMVSIFSTWKFRLEILDYRSRHKNNNNLYTGGSHHWKVVQYSVRACENKIEVNVPFISSQKCLTIYILTAKFPELGGKW